jgi:hypothetical protein
VTSLRKPAALSDSSIRLFAASLNLALRQLNLYYSYVNKFGQKVSVDAVLVCSVN